MADTRYLTVSEALSALLAPVPAPDDWDEHGPWEDVVHVFTNPGVDMLLGADWSRDSVKQAISAAKVRQIGGAQCRGMGHGLVVSDGDGWLFVEADESRITELDSTPSTEENPDG